MKWFVVIFFIVVGFALITGYTGGAKDAAANYNKVLSGRG